MRPSINVNLGKCADWCRVLGKIIPGCDHSMGCPGAPVLILCPIPRSVVFDVVLGECTCIRCDCGTDTGKHYAHCERRGLELYGKPFGGTHADHCPGRPVKVACSISGKTWEESEAVNAMRVGAIGREYHIPTDDKIQAACRARWVLVKALVMGKDPRHDVEAQALHTIHRQHRYFEQRDAVFAALADMSRAEQMQHESMQKVVQVVGEPEKWLALVPAREVAQASAPSARMLERYVTYLIEQVGSL